MGVAYSSVFYSAESIRSLQQMATVAERREKFNSLLERIIEETKSRYKDDYEWNNPSPVSLVQGWSRQVDAIFGLDSHQASHSILNDELKSRILHSKLLEFGHAIHGDYKYHGAFRNRRMDQPYVLLDKWEPENLLEKGVYFLLKRRDLVREIRIHLAKVELKGLQADLEWEMLESWKRQAVKEFITEIYVKEWNERSYEGITVANVETKEDYEHLDRELEAFETAIVKDSVSSNFSRTAHSTFVLILCGFVRQKDVAGLAKEKIYDGTFRESHQINDHWTAEAIIENAKARTRSRSSSSSTHFHVALSLSGLSARTCRHS